MTNWRALCEELVLGCDVDGCDWKPQHQARWNAAIERARALLAQPEPEVVGPSVEELDDLFNEIDQSGEPLSWRAYARAVLSRWGRPAPAPAGEVAKLAADIRHFLSGYRQMRGLDPEHIYSIHRGDAMEAHITVSGLTRIADLLEQRQAAPVPVASDVYFEFVVSGPDDCTQAGGIAPTYAQALSEGQHYLAQYQQDGPHTLEVRRVEVLPPGAFPVPDDAPVPLLPEDAQVIEPAQHTILAPAPVPVALSERPWEREGWCDSEGRCWIHCPGQSWDTWVLTVPQNAIDGAHCLPATALPKPSGEAQP